MLIANGQVEQAAIAAGSALLGAVVGGLFALLAGRQQRNHALTSRSHEAAARLLTTLAALSEAVASWEMIGDVAPLAPAVNTFTAATVAELPLLRDREVSRRVRNHVQFAFWVGSMAQHQPQQAAVLTRSASSSDHCTMARL